MTTLTQPVTLDPAARVRAAGLDLPAVGRLLVLLAVAGWLARSWWVSALVLPLSWEPPSAQALFLLPGAVVMGLLGLRLGVRRDDEVAAHLSAMTARWAAVWTGASLLWLVVTMAGQYGGLGRMLAAGNQVSVLSASPAATHQLVVVQVALLIALFGRQLGGRGEAVGLLALSGAALLAAFPFYAAGHGHGALGLPGLVPAMAAAQALALALWVGTLLALRHLTGGALALRRRLPAFGDLITAAVAVTGLAAVVAGLVYPGLATPPVLAVAEVAGLALLLSVGRRQRQRIADVVSTRRGVVLAGYAAGEVVVMVAVVLLTCWLPTGG